MDSPFFNEYSSPEEAIAAGKKLVNNTGEAESIIGQEAVGFVYNITSLLIVFSESRILEITAGPDGFQTMVSPEMPSVEKVESFRLIEEDGTEETWSSDIFLPFINRRFRRIHQEKRILWLYFAKADSLLVCTVSPLREKPSWLLHISTED